MAGWQRIVFAVYDVIHVIPKGFTNSPARSWKESFACLDNARQPFCPGMLRNGNHRDSMADEWKP